MKRIVSILLCICMAVGFCTPAMAAPEWPSNCTVSAGGAIVMDVDSGAVIYGHGIHEQYFPASITKILTALVVAEHVSNLNTAITFSHDAVYNVEAGSSSAGIDEGDTMTVRDALYAMLLMSANEAANALAEYVGKSRSGFADMMNEKAAELGCTNSNFVNPSGLNDPNHYTTAYDMALISRAAFSNPAVLDIASTIYYDLPPLKRYPEGQRIYIGHKMLKKNFAAYNPSAVAGKTGYTSLAGNTLITYAEKNGMHLVAVILKSSNPQHYTDTRSLLDFAFDNFQTLSIGDYESAYTSLENDLTIAGMNAGTKPVISLDKDNSILLPNNAVFEDAVSTLSYDLTSPHPDNAIAELNYTYNDRFIGRTYLEVNEELLASGTISALPTETLPEELIPTLESTEIEPQSEEEESQSNTEAVTAASFEDTEPTSKTGGFKIPALFWKIVAAILALGAIGWVGYQYMDYRKRREYEERQKRRQKREARLKEIGYSSEDFNQLMERHRINAINKPDKKKRRPNPGRKKRRR